ncbi:M15 family metallopeptidase [Demequina aurantiaca]|uniref:M15 family metallopeptidase n=1 Tax=Demequina aurantiaca TaxID=676200 RepID=UPI000783544D|nr:M15 family metallopeptidase [Demequina aurantiaca]
MGRAKHADAGVARFLPAAVTAVAGFALGLVVAWGVGHGNAAGPSTAASGDASTAPAHTAAPSESAIPRVTASASGTAEPVVAPSTVFDMDRYSIDEPDSPWVVVNKLRPLEPKTYVPNDLGGVQGVSFTDGGSIRAEAGDALAKMQEGAQAEGLSFRVSSAYRSFTRQTGLYSTYVNRSGTAKADTFSARPGYSEHQTGWSADLYDTAACRLLACFGDTEVGRFIADHGAEYGFIVRYPEGDQDITGYIYEPWHVRYVGVDLAMEMRDRGVDTLEEFFGLSDAPSYAS